jgi:hypothetical protein
MGIAIVWLSLALADLREWMIASILDQRRLRSRSTAQTLVEWSVAAAVLAFVGYAAWQAVGVAVTDAANRIVISLNKSGAGTS